MAKYDFRNDSFVRLDFLLSRCLHKSQNLWVWQRCVDLGHAPFCCLSPHTPLRISPWTFFLHAGQTFEKWFDQYFLSTANKVRTTSAHRSLKFEMLHFFNDVLQQINMIITQLNLSEQWKEIIVSNQKAEMFYKSLYEKCDPYGMRVANVAPLIQIYVIMTTNKQLDHYK